MPKINLAQEAIRNQVIGRRRRLLYGFSVAILVLTVGLWGLFFFLTSQVQTRVDEVQTEVRRLEAQLRTRENDVREIVLFRERLKSLEHALASRVLWSRILEEFERLTTPSSTFLTLRGNASDRNIVADVRVPSLDAGADLVAALQTAGESYRTFFSSVVVTTLKAVESATGVSGYTLQMKLSAIDRAFQPANLSSPTASSAAPAVTTGSPVAQ